MKPIIILVITLPLNADEKDLLFSLLNAIWEKGRWSNSQAAVMIEHQRLSCVRLNDTMTTSYGASSFINSRGSNCIAIGCQMTNRVEKCII